jgi:hypothetical protein
MVAASVLLRPGSRECFDTVPRVFDFPGWPGGDDRQYGDTMNQGTWRQYHPLLPFVFIINDILSKLFIQLFALFGQIMAGL